MGIFGQDIQDGYSDSKDRNVVGILDSSIGALCSGSLIAPNVVLTARHCVSDTSEQVACGDAKPGPLHGAKYFHVTTRANFDSKSPADYHSVREVIGLPLDPKSKDPLLSKEDLCGRDMAILILEGTIDPAEATPRVPRVDSDIGKGDEYYAIGYGAVDDQGSEAGYRRRRDDLHVKCVGAACPSYAKKSELIGETGICQGDSGGPAVDTQDRVVGVTSRGSAGCTDPIYGNVASWGQWLQDTVTYASQPAIGNYDPPGWATGRSTDVEYNGPVGGACGLPGCPSNICINTGTDLGEYCSRKCDEVNTCPDGFECNADLGLCADAPKPPEITDSSSGTGPSIDASPGAIGITRASAGGCSISSGPDPTTPIPWNTAAVFAVALGALGWRRRR